MEPDKTEFDNLVNEISSTEAFLVWADDNTIQPDSSPVTAEDIFEFLSTKGGISIYCMKRNAMNIVHSAKLEVFYEDISSGKIETTISTDYISGGLRLVLQALYDLYQEYVKNSS